jgi:AcrR family transcriptional regulator
VERKRKLIAEQAEKLFCRKGYNNTNMRELAKACNMSPGKIYRYIGAKEDIIHLLSRKHTQTTTGVLEKLYQRLDKKNWLRVLKQCLARYFNICHQDQDYLMFINREAVYFPKTTRVVLREGYEKDILIFQEILNNGITAGQFKEHDTFFVAQHIVLAGHAWILRRWYLRFRYSIKEYIDINTEFVLAYIRK